MNLKNPFCFTEGPGPDRLGFWLGGNQGGGWEGPGARPDPVWFPPMLDRFGFRAFRPGLGEPGWWGGRARGQAGLGLVSACFARAWGEPGWWQGGGVQLSNVYFTR